MREMTAKTRRACALAVVVSAALIGCSKPRVPPRPGLSCKAPDTVFVDVGDGEQIQKWAVTAHDYECCIAAGGCEEGTILGHDHRGCTAGDDRLAQHPINCVNFAGAKQYCGWIKARLPTEALWLRAVGTDKQRYPWGSHPVAGRANCDQGVCGDRWPVTAPVRAFEQHAAGCGAVQLAGNVFAWLDQWYDERPQTPAHLAVAARTYRLLKGGSWREHEHAMRNDARHYKRPTEKLSNIGFRCAR